MKFRIVTEVYCAALVDFATKYLSLLFAEITVLRAVYQRRGRCISSDISSAFVFYTRVARFSCRIFPLVFIFSYPFAQRALSRQTPAMNRDAEISADQSQTRYLD